MKKLIVACAALGALGETSFAADLAPYYAPPPVPVPAWTGFYIGVNAGWIGSSDNTITNTGTDTGPGGLGAAEPGNTEATLAFELTPSKSASMPHTQFGPDCQL
jgi:outer membrane immunogenic protein